MRAACIRRKVFTFAGECKSKELAWILSSAEATAEDFHTYVRSHWGIENKSHYVRDTTWSEDAHQAYTGNGPRVMATLRNLAAGILRLNGVGDIKRTTERIARDRYRAHVAKVLALAGIAGGEDRAKAIMDLETRMARVHATRAESFEVREAYNPWKHAEFDKRAPGLDWTAFLDGAGLSQQPMLVVWQPKAISGLAALVKQVPLATWKDWMTFHLLDRSSAYLPRAFVQEHFDFSGYVLAPDAGAPATPARTGAPPARSSSW